MDRAIFDRKVQKLRNGEFVQDPSFYAYGSDAIYEIKTLADALWQCCSAQATKIDLLERKNLGLQKINKELTKRVFELTKKLHAVGCSPFDVQLEGEAYDEVL